ncbi:MAG: hypothetical protein KC474_10625 [Cyanobacteria bacterium HKST-UBA04]|nr:hypothetical protein [Cyanobacteria bacterium HKST-UBA04]
MIRVLQRLLGGLAFVVLGLLLGKAVAQFPPYYDDWWYHLLFAARHGGLVAMGDFMADSRIEARFTGMPQLAEMIQGWLWVTFGNVKAVNFLGYTSFLALVAGLRLLWRLPVYYTVFAMLAIPIVGAHVVTVKNDLLHNVCLVLAVAAAFKLYCRPDHPRRWWLVGLVALMGVGVCHTKYTLVGAALLVYLTTLLRLGWYDWQHRTALGPWLKRWGLVVIPLAVVGLVLMAYPYLKNAFVLGNPVYPYHVQVLGINFPGPEEPVFVSSTTIYGAPQPVRWLYSIIEFGVRPFHWEPEVWAASPGDYTFRMGGFFGAYVFFQLGLFALNLLRTDSDGRRWIPLIMGVLTLMVACMHQSHELRYVMGWMMLLVAFNGYMIMHPSVGRGLGRLSSWAITVLAVYCLGWFLVVAGFNQPNPLLPLAIDHTQVERTYLGFFRYYVDRLHPKKEVLP